MENCIFCRIIKGEIPAARIWEDDKHLAFLTIQPINPGHTLVIPKKHVDYFFDLEDGDLGNLMKACKPLAKALKKAFNPKTGRVGIMVGGTDVPHVHVHLVPMNDELDLTFERQKDASPQELQEIAQKVKESLE